MVKINEVARAAGVSISTVSYALSGKRPVAAETKARIEKIIRDLDYRPNAGARMLAGRRTHIFALTQPLRPDTHAPTHMAFVLAASIAARRSDYDLLLLTEEEASAGMRRVASSGLVDGFLALDVAPADERVGLARSLDVPTVFIGVPDDHDGLVCVDLDFEAAAGDAVDRLADAGHTDIALIGQPSRTYEKSNFPPRVRAGFCRRAQARGIRHHECTSGIVRHSSAAVRGAVAELLDAGVTGFVVHAGEETPGVLLAELSARELEVPRDVSVISVANTFDVAGLPTPLDDIPLVPQDSCDLAVDLVLRARDEPLQPRVHLISPQHHARGSVEPRRV